MIGMHQRAKAAPLVHHAGQSALAATDLLLHTYVEVGTPLNACAYAVDTMDEPGRGGVVAREQLRKRPLGQSPPHNPSGSRHQDAP